MGRNYFVSYKYHDRNVRQIGHIVNTTARDYVDLLTRELSDTELNYRGEKDGDDLTEYAPEYIQKTLSDRIFYTSVTIVLVSAGMKVPNLHEDKQWIPWEIAYSLRNKSRTTGTSYMNAVLAVALPDKQGRYEYAMRTSNGVTVVNTKNLFQIINRNMFNGRDGKSSYICLCKWDNFIRKPEYYLDIALQNRSNWQDFNMVKTIDSRW
ncbi:MAG: TIR domain-containing protein [archaeon]|nr:TIR domain-containing protein [archaeon]